MKKSLNNLLNKIKEISLNKKFYIPFIILIVLSFSLGIYTSIDKDKEYQLKANEAFKIGEESAVLKEEVNELEKIISKKYETDDIQATSQLIDTYIYRDIMKRYKLKPDKNKFKQYEKMVKSFYGDDLTEDELGKVLEQFINFETVKEKLYKFPEVLNQKKIDREFEIFYKNNYQAFKDNIIETDFKTFLFVVVEDKNKNKALKAIKQNNYKQLSMINIPSPLQQPDFTIENVNYKTLKNNYPKEIANKIYNSNKLDYLNYDNYVLIFKLKKINKKVNKTSEKEIKKQMKNIYLSELQGKALTRKLKLENEYKEKIICSEKYKKYLVSCKNGKVNELYETLVLNKK